MLWRNFLALVVLSGVSGNGIFCVPFIIAICASLPFVSPATGKSSTPCLAGKDGAFPSDVMWFRKLFVFF